MEWHRATETPKPDTEVLAEVKGFKHNRFIVLIWTKEGWWQHIPRMNGIMSSDGWVGTHGLFVIRWAYIDEKDLTLTAEDITTLIRLCEQVKTEWWFRDMKGIGTQKHFEEVLRRFNEMKEEK